MMKIALVAVPLLIVAGSLLDHDSSAADKPKLFAIRGDAKRVPEADRSSIASVREAEIDITVDGAALAEQPSIVIPLFDGEVSEAYVSRTERRSPTDITWAGKIRFGKMNGDVTITHRNGFVSGLIYGSRSVYEIVPRGEKHILVELDQSLFPECGGGVVGPKGDGVTNAAPSVGIDSGDRLDVMVVYTTATKTFLGGDAQAQAFAQQAIDSTNTAYINSRIRQRVRLVHSEEFVYTETPNGASTDLANLRSNAMIQALRDTHKADLVAEISEVTGVCGVGYLLNVNGGVPNNAFTVTVRSCAVGGLTFAHELGHNMGAHHNPENGGAAVFPFGFGHYVNGNFRTIMSYVNPCTNGCTRRQYFSNPTVMFNDVPTGIDGARDNARMLNTTADWVAAYRYSGTNLTLTNFAGGDWFPRLVRRNVTWTSEGITGDVRIELSRDEGDTWETLVASTPNDGSHPISLSGRATRRARVRISSLSNPLVSDSSSTNISIR